MVLATNLDFASSAAVTCTRSIAHTCDSSRFKMDIPQPKPGEEAEKEVRGCQR